MYVKEGSVLRVGGTVLRGVGSCSGVFLFQRLEPSKSTINTAGNFYRVVELGFDSGGICLRGTSFSSCITFLNSRSTLLSSRRCGSTLTVIVSATATSEISGREFALYGRVVGVSRRVPIRGFKSLR